MHRLVSAVLVYAMPVFAAAPADSAAFPQATSALPILPGDPQLGPREAPLTLVLFTDELRMLRAFLKDAEPLRKKYGNKLRIVSKHVAVNPSLHPDSPTLVAAARGVYALAGEAAFVKYVELVATHEGKPDQETLIGLALVAGVKDRKAMSEGMLTQQWLKEVRASDRLATELDALMPEPCWYLNGLQHRGFPNGHDFAALYPVFDKELEASAAALKQGFKPLDVYGYRVKSNIDRTVAPTSDSMRKHLEVTAESIGPLRLGMKRDEVKAIMRVKDWKYESCANFENGGDDCIFHLWFDEQGLFQIAYDIEAGDGFTYDGKFVSGSANGATVSRVLGCVDDRCPGHLLVMEGGIRCLKTFADDGETACVDAAGGRNRSKLRKPPQLRLKR